MLPACSVHSQGSTDEQPSHQAAPSSRKRWTLAELLNPDIVMSPSQAHTPPFQAVPGRPAGLLTSRSQSIHNLATPGRGGRSSRLQHLDQEGGFSFREPSRLSLSLENDVGSQEIESPVNNNSNGHGPATRDHGGYKAEGDSSEGSVRVRRATEAPRARDSMRSSKRRKLTQKEQNEAREQRIQHHCRRDVVKADSGDSDADSNVNGISSPALLWIYD